MKAPVTRRALEARLKRHLAKEGLSLRKCNPASRWYSNFGDYYTVDIQLNVVCDKYMDLEGWSREVGVMKQFEELAED